MNKLNALGIGPKIGMIAIPYLIVAIVLTHFYGNIFSIGGMIREPLFWAGVVLLVIGVVFYLVTVRLLLKGIKTTALMTTGTYYLCQNPLYSCMILMLVPGISLVIHSWLCLTTAVVAYILFKINIRSEYREMESVFGDEYLAYKARTPEIIPFPVRKWSGKE